MGWFSRRTKEKPTLRLEELSAALQSALRSVHAACEQCEQAQGDEFVDAWRGLHHTMRAQVATLAGLLGEGPSPRLERMIQLTTGELWQMAEPHLVARVPATADDMALLHRTLWDRAEAARADLVDRRRDPAPRDRLRCMADQFDAAVDALGGGTDEDREAAADLRHYVNLALG